MKSWLVLAVLMLSCRRAPPRPSPVITPAAAPAAAILARGERAPIEAILERTAEAAALGGRETRLVTFRASCMDALGRLRETCSGNTWSGQPVYGFASVPAVGMLSVDYQRRNASGADRFGVTATQREQKSAARAGAWDEGYQSGPQCRVAQVLERASQQRFDMTRPFALGFAAGMSKTAGSWHLFREGDELRVADSCEQR
jgi:hypothetical protein